jgi:hypothetical protein
MTAESAVKHRLATDKRIGSFIQFVWLSALLLADDEGVGGEAWTCDGQTNGIFFVQFVCPSTLLLDGIVW